MKYWGRAALTYLAITAVLYGTNAVWSQTTAIQTLAIAADTRQGTWSVLGGTRPGATPGAGMSGYGDLK